MGCGQQITRSINGLLEAGVIGALLAVLILYVFLRRLAPTLVIGFAIPFSMVGTIGFMYLLGKTLNVLSMMGLMLAAGMLVDNAVVVLESIYQKIEKVMIADSGDCRHEEVLSAVVAATMTSIILFVPLVFGEKTNCQFGLRTRAHRLFLPLLCSLFISFDVDPISGREVSAG